MSDVNHIPPNLLDTYSLIKCAFPHEITSDDYWSLVAVLHKTFSFRSIAMVLSVLTNKAYIEVYNDASGFTLADIPSIDYVNEVKKRLMPCGYEEWMKKQT